MEQIIINVSLAFLNVKVTSLLTQFDSSVRHRELVVSKQNFII